MSTIPTEPTTQALRIRGSCPGFRSRAVIDHQKSYSQPRGWQNERKQGQKILLFRFNWMISGFVICFNSARFPDRNRSQIYKLHNERARIYDVKNLTGRRHPSRHMGDGIASRNQKFQITLYLLASGMNKHFKQDRDSSRRGVTNDRTAICECPNPGWSKSDVPANVRQHRQKKGGLHTRRLAQLAHRS